MIDIVALILMFIGLVFVLVGTLGVFRFEDVYLRLQAATKALTFGFGFLIFGAGLLTHDPDKIAKAVLVVIFQFLTAPISAQVLARVALRRGIKPIKMRGWYK